ncbi:hypothetical protein [uncultured Desulfobulbus sp.]|uniref:hypothetical protein n=1 Tax=uncultured Desulfobulbus sp. TaxID=239745 RepID=UPI0029C645A9|nr:hypothetical protein [uncultured Desulfobulbus sp.]
MTTVPRFPRLAQHKSDDDNAAIQIFGRRFYKDQTDIEYLVEFLLVFLSPKTVFDSDVGWGCSLPDREIMARWPENSTLKYTPEPRLGLKLFSFLGSSKLETRHGCHKQHFKQIITTLKERIETEHISKDEVLELLEQLLYGFVGVAANRTWCTQVYLPVSTRLVACETIWKRVMGNQNPDIQWDNALDDPRGFFTFTQHDFLARGGEILYLQLCNLIRYFNSPELVAFEEKNKFRKGQAEDAVASVTSGLNELFQKTSPIDSLCEWIEAADQQTNRLIKRNPAQCGWCPEESWKEAYLFACEFANICRSSIDPLEKIEMLTLCCVLQVLRSLCAQACRYSGTMNDALSDLGGACGFSWIISPEQLDDPVLKETAKSNLVRVQEVIHGALRHPDIVPSTRTGANDPEKRGDEQGHELFVSLAKRIGFIIPKTGPGARMVISDKLLRYLVLALIPPGEKRTLQSFEQLMYCYYGMATGGPLLEKAIKWTHPRQKLHMTHSDNKWLEEDLLAAGFLLPLSDAVSQVTNPF